MTSATARGGERFGGRVDSGRSTATGRSWALPARARSACPEAPVRPGAARLVRRAATGHILRAPFGRALARQVDESVIT